MKKIAVALAILLTTTWALATNARATSTYDGTLTGSISIAGCLSGAILQNCALSGLNISGNADSSSPVITTSGTAVANATQNVTAGSGISYSITSTFSGSASDPGSSAISLTFPSPTISVRNTTSSDVTLVLDYSFLYTNTIAVDFPSNETAFSFSEFDLNRVDSSFGIPFNVEDLFDSSCSNINPPQFGLTSDPCADSDSGRLFLTIDGCVGIACDVVVTSISLDASQIGLAAVVPEPGSLLLFASGLTQLGLMPWLRRRRSSPRPDRKTEPATTS